jgi:hypothetical protein
MSRIDTSETYGSACLCLHGWLRQGVVVAAIVLCIFLLEACEESAGGASQAHVSHITQVASHEEVLLIPVSGAGGGGWCVTTRRTGGSGACPTSHLPARLGPFLGPIVIEDWSGRSSTSEGPVNEAVILTTSEVGAVSLEGRAPVTTRAEVVLPDHLRAAVIELRGGAGRGTLGIAAPPPFPRSHFTALNSKGEEIPQTHAPGPPLEFQVPSQTWGRSQRTPRGVCGLEPRGIEGLLFEGGGVMTVVRPHANIRGREFVDCVDTTYLLDNWPLEADVLLDAAHPGSTPAPLPAMLPLTGHPGVFRGPGVEGEMLVRRIPGAWLVVTKGEGLQQRLTLLEHLRATVHL